MKKDSPDRSILTMESEPIRRRKLAHDVQDRLLAMIRRGDLAPGDVMPSERELMAQLTVGRPAIREAMQSLQRMGLVEIRHGERARLTEPSIGGMVEQISETMRHLLVHSSTTLEHLKEARVTFETEMARIAAKRRTKENVEMLSEILKAQAAARRNPEKFLELDGRFHREIAAVSGNPIFASLNEALFSWLASFHVALVRKLGLEKLTLEEHDQILEAIERGDVERAGQAMADHLNRANALYNQEHYGAVS
jgi:GntR family transcriptional regulator, sialic acid-inducible nan operon repressor